MCLHVPVTKVLTSNGGKEKLYMPCASFALPKYVRFCLLGILVSVMVTASFTACSISVRNRRIT